MSSLSVEQENYVRIVLLLTGFSTRAVRALFDREIPPTYLPSTLNKKYNKLLRLQKIRVINQAQWDLLFPPLSGVADSKTFDVTLLICLIRNLTSVTPPALGFDCLPSTGETTPGADLARIKYYRNYQAHLDDNKIDNSDFATAWNDISDAIGRLGGASLYHESQALKTKVLDQSISEIMLEVKNLKSSHGRFQDYINTKHAQTTKEIEELKTCFQKFTHTSETLKETVPLNIREQIKAQLEKWKEKDQMFVDTRAASHVLQCIKTHSCVTVTGNPGVGKTFTVRHVALQMAADEYDILLVEDPEYIIKLNNHNKKTLYVIDNLCGTYTLNQTYLDKWKTTHEKIQKLLENNRTKIIASCRLLVYQDERFKLLPLFTACECNVLLPNMSLSKEERRLIAETYLKSDASKISQYTDSFDFFPLLCKLYSEHQTLNVVDFFKNPFSVYEKEIDKLKTEKAYGPAIPDEIKKMGPESINLYSKLLQSGTEKKTNIRVIIVGKKGSGKTSLIRRLLREDASNVESTNGIEINNCSVRLEDGKWMKNAGGHAFRERLLKKLVDHYHKEKEGSLNEVLISPSLIPSTEVEVNSVAEVETAHGETLKLNAPAYSEETDLHAKRTGYAVDLIDHLQTVMEADHGKEEAANLFLWDFAGDEEFYNTHQIFLAKDVIYLVVTKLGDLSHEQGSFQFWFNSVHCFSNPPDEDEQGFVYPPIIVVGTHADQYGNIKECDNIMKMQLDKLPSKVRKHIREIELLSNTKDPDDKLDKLREKIMTTAEQGKNWNIELPVKFILLEQELQHQRELGKPILSFDDIKSIAKNTLEPILERDQLKLFLQYQHEIGNLVYYNDIPECIVLDTQWLSDVFKCIITADTFQLALPRFDWSEVCSTGRLDNKLLAAIFAKQSQYIHINKDFLVKLMEKFYILVRPRILSEKNTIERSSEYYVPCLVKTMALKDVDRKFQVPEIKSKSLCLCLVFNFLPPMLFNHLLIACCCKPEFSSATTEINGKTWPAFFKDIAVFNISPNCCEKLLLARFEQVIPLQIWRYVEKFQTFSYQKIRCFVVEEINRLIAERFRLTNVTYREMMKCSETMYDSLDGIRDYIKDPSIQEYMCDKHKSVHSFTDDWHGNDDDEALSTEQLNFTRIGIIILDIMADALYDRLKFDDPSVQHRSNHDITSLYDKHRKLNLNIPSDGHWGGKNKKIMEDILASHTSIGDDFERIRLIRNELQHYKWFSLSDVRCDELFKVAKDILHRFDIRNKPIKSYCDRAEAVRRMKYTKFYHKKVEEDVKQDQHHHQYTAENIEVHYHYYGTT